MSAECIACFPWKGKRAGEGRISVGVAVEGQLAECAQLEWGERARKRRTEEIPWFKVIWTTILVCCVIPNAAIKCLDFVTTELWLAFIWLACLYLFFDYLTCLLRCAVLLQWNKDSHRIYKRHSCPPNLCHVCCSHTNHEERLRSARNDSSPPQCGSLGLHCLQPLLIPAGLGSARGTHHSTEEGSSRADQLHWWNAAGAAATLI